MKNSKKSKKPELTWLEWSLVCSLLGLVSTKTPKSKLLQQTLEGFKPKGWEKLGLIYKKINTQLYEWHLGMK